MLPPMPMSPPCECPPMSIFPDPPGHTNPTPLPLFLPDRGVFHGGDPSFTGAGGQRRVRSIFVLPMTGLFVSLAVQPRPPRYFYFSWLECQRLRRQCIMKDGSFDSGGRSPSPPSACNKSGYRVDHLPNLGLISVGEDMKQQPPSPSEISRSSRRRKSVQTWERLIFSGEEKNLADWSNHVGRRRAPPVGPSGRAGNARTPSLFAAAALRSSPGRSEPAGERRVRSAQVWGPRPIDQPATLRSSQQRHPTDLKNASNIVRAT